MHKTTNSKNYKILHLFFLVFKKSMGKIIKYIILKVYTESEKMNRYAGLKIFYNQYNYIRLKNHSGRHSIFIFIFIHSINFFFLLPYTLFSYSNFYIVSCSFFFIKKKFSSLIFFFIRKLFKHFRTPYKFIHPNFYTLKS